MTKRKASLYLQTDLSEFVRSSYESQTNGNKAIVGYSIEKELTTCTTNESVRTSKGNDYMLHVNHFADDVTKVKYIEEVTADYIYEWLSSMNVNNQT